MTIPLTQKQKEAFDFIRRYIGERGIAPSTVEIASALGLHSKSGVSRLVSALVHRGAITRIPNVARGIAVADALIGENYLPLIDEMAAHQRVTRKDVVELALLEYLQNHPIQGGTS
jgi:repressor LexA